MIQLKKKHQSSFVNKYKSIPNSSQWCNMHGENEWIYIYIQFNSIQFKIICMSLFTIQSLQSSFSLFRGRNRETNRGIISVAVVPSKQKVFVQP